jgi:signal transduction histidine kinase
VAALFVGVALQDDLNLAALGRSQEASLSHTVAETVRLRGVVYENFAADYSHWGEMADFAAQPNAEWAKVNLEGSLNNFKFEGLWVFDAQSKQAYSLGAQSSLAVLLTQEKVPDVAGLFRSGSFFQAFALNDEGSLLEFRGAKIQREEDVNRSAPARGFLLIMKVWSQDYVDQFAPVVGGRLRVESAAGSCDHHGAASDTVAGFAIKSTDQSSVGWLCAVVNNPINEQFKQHHERTGLIFALFVGLLLATLGFSLSRLILRPLGTITEGIRCNEHPDLLAVGRTRTEFGALARLVIAHGHAEQERAKLQAEVAQAGKLASLGVMGAVVAHELNNPLAVVLGYADLLASKPSTAYDAETQQALEAILSQAERMRRVVDRVRDFSLEQRRGPQRKPEDLNRIVNRSLRLLEPDLRKADIALQLHLDLDLPTVDCDQVQIETVVQNLVNNAREALERAESAVRVIELSTRAVEAEVIVEVADSGPGMGDEPEQFFAPFVSSKPVGSGSGLGLAISNGIAKEHQGSLHYERSKHGGALFRLSLPRSEVL